MFAPDLYRSSLPRAVDIRRFAEFGGKCVADLTQRPRPVVERACDRFRVEYHKQPIPHEFSGLDVSVAADYLDRLPLPVLVHCFHGHGRTGAVVRELRRRRGLHLKVVLRGVGRNMNRAIRAAYSLGADSLVAIQCSKEVGTLRSAALLPAEWRDDDDDAGSPSRVVLCQRAATTITSVQWRSDTTICVGGETSGWPRDGSPRVSIPALPLELTVESALSVAIWEARCR